ncbi:MAG: MlaD family protein [Methylotetracoccus sp.]|jgi:phospholipid/cholesterol/gamma-HCH transport system substrate-binding protein|nr:MlaD family protein [Methylotetracoccus sp.]
MSRESYALLTGLFVIALGAALIGIANYLGDYGIQREVYTVVSRGSVAGLNPESTVIYRGVPAGKVASIRFDPEDVGTVLVQIEIEPGLPMTQGTYAMLRVQPLTGLAQIELADAGDHPVPLLTDPKDPARLPLRPSVFEKLTASAQELLPQLAEVANRLSSLADEKNRAQLQKILGNLDLATRELIAVEARLNETLATLPQLSIKAQKTLTEMAHLTRDLAHSSREIRSLARNTDGLVASGKEGLEALNRRTIPKADALITDLQRAAASLARLSRQLEADPQVLLLGRQPPPPGPGEPGYGDQR